MLAKASRSLKNVIKNYIESLPLFALFYRLKFTVFLFFLRSRIFIESNMVINYGECFQGVKVFRDF